MILKLYLDEDAMDDDLVRALRARKVDVTSVKEVKRQRYSDEEQLLYATEQGRVVYTFNIKDFADIHTTFLMAGISHAGMILVQRDRYSIGEQMRRILRIISEKSAAGVYAALTFYHANQAQLDTDFAAEDIEADKIEQDWLRSPVRVQVKV